MESRLILGSPVQFDKIVQIMPNRMRGYYRKIVVPSVVTPLRGGSKSDIAFQWLGENCQQGSQFEAFHNELRSIERLSSDCPGCIRKWPRD